MTRKRLTYDERRESIVHAARGIFSLRGYKGARTKEIADAAGVSEALLYHHFPSKEALYEEITKTSDKVLVSLWEQVAEIVQNPPSSKMLVEFWYFTMQIICAPHDKKENETSIRLLGQSMLADGDYFRSIQHKVVDNILYPFTKKCVEAAIEAGDVEDWGCNKHHFPLYAEQLAFAFRLLNMPDGGVLDYQTDDDREIFHEMVVFALRGLGMKPKAIEKYFDADALVKKYGSLSWRIAERAII